MRRCLIVTLALLGVLAFAGGGIAHDLDHPAPGFAPTAPPSAAFLASPASAWSLVATIPTGNPHTDLDFFTQNGEIYASAGTLATGANAGGQTLLRLTKNGEVTPASPQYVAAHPSASCVSDPAAALGLQHDVEATPKGNVLLNATYAKGVPAKGDAQLILDATDNEGRCHDAASGGVAPSDAQGGVEIVDVTDIARPKEIGLTSHIGEAHTVNVDPKRPHIAFAVTSDSVNVSCNADDTSCTRANENPASSQRYNLDGFELIDLSSCMNFAALTPLDLKRAMCRPQVYRYRYPSALIALGHTADALAGCHELEIYPNDTLTCASINATLQFDLSGASTTARLTSTTTTSPEEHRFPAAFGGAARWQPTPRVRWSPTASSAWVVRTSLFPAGLLAAARRSKASATWARRSTWGAGARIPPRRTSM